MEKSGPMRLNDQLATLPVVTSSTTKTPLLETAITSAVPDGLPATPGESPLISGTDERYSCELPSTHGPTLHIPVLLPVMEETESDASAGACDEVDDALPDDSVSSTEGSSGAGEGCDGAHASDAVLPSSQQVQLTPTIPGKLINFINSPATNLLRVNILLNNVETTAVLDTGAAKSMISNSLANSLNLSILPVTESLNVVGQERLYSVGKAYASVSIRGVPMTDIHLTVFNAASDSNVSLLLGIDFLKQNQIELCISRRLLIKHFSAGGLAEIFLDDDCVSPIMFYNLPCFAACNVTIERHATEPIPVSCVLPCVDSDHVALYHSDSMDSRLSDKVRGLPGIFDPDRREVLMVTSDQSIDIKKGQSVGAISSMLQLPEGELDEQNFTSWTDHDIRNKILLPELTLDQQTEVFTVIQQYKSVFSTGEHDIGHASVTKHRIRLTDDTPIYQRPRRFPKPINDEIERQCQELNALDIIEPSISPWSSPVVPVRKKDGTVRMCIDYRRVNRVTIPDKFPVPNLSDSLFGLRGTFYFSRLDLIRGYYQHPIEEDSRQYTAFSTQKNHWQFKRLSFGLRNAPSAFQREIQAVLHTFPSNKVIAYIDDILIMGNSFSEHLSLVAKVLQTLHSYNIKVKPSKCEFFRSSIEYLGHICSRTGIRKTDEYVKKVASYPRPDTLGELRAFLGLINFQRKYLPRCSEIQKPLSCLTGGRRSKLLDWTPDMVNAFETLKQEMQHDIELSYPDYSEDASKLELYVDASNYGAGAYLAQEQNGCQRIIGFASMTFNNAQLNYSTLDRELAALRWGVKTFKPFLYGVYFIIYSDHQVLTHLHSMKLICSRSSRILEELAEFNFEVRYIPGHLNSAADTLSRLGLPLPPAELYGSGSCQSLPNGLVIDGLPVPGGGDSLFVSVLKSLRSAAIEGVPETDLELREKVVDQMLNHSDKYNVSLDRESRKNLRRMRIAGQLPSYDLLLVVSHLFKIKICVYFWTAQPVIYQYQDYESSIFLQCISGIHFNPLIQTHSYITPPVSESSVYTVTIPNVPIVVCSENDVQSYETPLTDNLFSIDSGIACNHPVSCLPQVYLSFDDMRLCAIIDSGAEISLVSERALDFLFGDGKSQEIVPEPSFYVIGLNGETTSIDRSITLPFNVGSNQKFSHKFAIVPHFVFPHCFLLGLDFLFNNNIDIDLRTNHCKVNGTIVAHFNDEPLQQTSLKSVLHFYSVFTINVPNDASHSIKLTKCHDDVRLELTGDSSTITGLSVLLDDDLIQSIQTNDPDLSLIKSSLNNDVVPNWSESLKPYKPHMSHLSIINDVLVYVKGNQIPIIVVPFNILLDIAIMLHYNFAHIGRDKLVNLLTNLVWHPSKYRICNEVATTCHDCQCLKTFSTPKTPPVLKIVTHFPFELVAVDLVSLPRTSAGYIGCLVVVDHYSKWLSAIPIKDKKSLTIVNALSDHVFPNLLQLPTVLLCDNGPEFGSNIFTEFLSNLGISQQLTTPYCPSSNGAVERVNRTIQGFLRSLTDQYNRWDSYLSKAISVYNNTMHSELVMSPSQFLLSKSHTVQTRVPVDVAVRETWKTGHPKFLPYSINQLVLYQAQHSGYVTTNKFMPYFRGPYYIAKAHPNNKTYEIKHRHSGDVLRAHHSQLRPYNEPPHYISSHPFIVKLNEPAPTHLNMPNLPFPISSSNVTEESSDSSFSSMERINNSENSLNFNSDSHSSFSGFVVSDPNSSRVTEYYKLTNVDGGDGCSSCKCCRYETVKELGGAVDALASRSESFITSPFTSLNLTPAQSILPDRWTEVGDWQLSAVESVNVSDNESVDSSVSISRSSHDGADISVINIHSTNHVSTQCSVNTDCSNVSTNHTSTQCSNDINTIDVSTNTENVSIHSDNSSNLLIIDTAGSGYGASPPQPPGCAGDAEQREVPVAGSSVQLGGEVDDSFCGFLLDPALDHRAIRLFKITEKRSRLNVNSTDTLSANSNFRVTRSQGPVDDLPNVQTHTLERRRPDKYSGNFSS